MAIGLSVLPGVVVDRVGEVAVDGAGDAVTARRLRGEDDLERVVRVLGPRDRRPAGLDAIDEVAKPFRPLPVRIAVGIDPPGRLLVAPQLPTLRGPVVAEQLDRALAAVELDRR